MKGHLDADVLAEYRAWLITGRRRRAIAAHLSGCTECAALDARLAQVSALLAATPAPSMPDAVSRRLDDALAAEVHRPIPAERHSVPAKRRGFPLGRPFLGRPFLGRPFLGGCLPGACPGARGGRRGGACRGWLRAQPGRRHLRIVRA